MKTKPTRVSRKDPFDVKLTEESRKEWTTRLVEEIRTGKQARSAVMDDGGLIDFAYSLYEQRSQQSISRDTPRYGSADLTSPIGTENVDSLSARAAQTLFKLEPFWIVEGLGDAADKAPVVEEFMQWRQEAIRLQKVAKKAITASFVEYGSVLEVCEDAEKTMKHETVKAKLLVSEIDGTIVLDGKTGRPLAMTDEAGEPVPAEQADLDAEAFVEVHRAYPDYRRRGAYVRRRSMKDFMFLPNHAGDDREVWGHATRFWLTKAEIDRRIKDGEYDKSCQELMGGNTSERQQSPEADRIATTVQVTPDTNTAEKELWKVQLWADVDGKGQCFYTAVVSEYHGCILSLKYDWLDRYRTVYVNPYPCPYSVYGYSMILVKLLTTIEEHTTWRNMNADRDTINAQKPILRSPSCGWDPEIQPFGHAEVIDANKGDITVLEFEGSSQQALNKEAQCVTDGQRIIGLNDIAIGQLSKASRTLGENTQATQASFTRTDDPIANIQEAFEEVGAIMHAIEVQTLRDMDDGMDAPAMVTQKLQVGDSSFDGVFRAGMLEGEFRFKPRGSSESADPQRRQQEAQQATAELAGLAKLNPFIAARVASPGFADAALTRWANERKVRDRAWITEPLPQPGMPPGMEGQPQQGMLPPGQPPVGPQFGGEQVLAQALAHAQGGQPQ